MITLYRVAFDVERGPFIESKTINPPAASWRREVANHLSAGWRLFRQLAEAELTGV